MTSSGLKLDTAKEQAAAKAHQAAGKAQQAAANPWVDRLARFGYVVRGVLYIVVGLLAVQVALGRGGQTTDKGGAIETIGSQPFGKLLLILIAVGLVGYSLWGFIRAFLDPLGRGTDPKGLAQRAGYVVSGLSYGALIFPTVQFILGAGGGGGGQSGAAQTMSARLLAQPFGPWLVGLFGLIGMVGGFGQIWQGVTAGFKKDFKLGEMSHDEETRAIWAGRIGMIARGIIFVLTGFFILQAALHVDPKQAKGLDGALQTLVQQPYGPWLLGAVALGLVAFGIFSIMAARWIKTRSSGQPTAKS